MAQFTQNFNVPGDRVFRVDSMLARGGNTTVGSEVSAANITIDGFAVTTTTDSTDGGTATNNINFPVFLSDAAIVIETGAVLFGDFV